MCCTAVLTFALVDPGDYEDIDALTERFAELTPDLVEEVREMLKPYFLRRTKDLVLNLPPLVRSFSRSECHWRRLHDSSSAARASRARFHDGSAASDLPRCARAQCFRHSVHRADFRQQEAGCEAEEGRLRVRFACSPSGTANSPRPDRSNILMELRKSLCHPYLTDRDIEPQNVSPQEAHGNLTNASAKFVLLATMLPKLKAAGHRVLIVCPASALSARRWPH